MEAGTKERLLLEPIRISDIFDQEGTGTLRVMVPVCRGGIIGLDNTCKTVLELQQFFGFKQGRSFLGSLSGYIKDLRLYSALAGQDLSSHIDQIDNYKSIITAIQKQDDFKDCLAISLGTYPEVIQNLLSKRNNIFGIRISVQSPHDYLRMPEKSLLFSGGQYLSEVLWTELEDLPGVKSPRERFIDKMNDWDYHGESTLQDYANQMSLVVRELFGCDISFETTEERVREALGVEQGDDLEHEDYIEGLLGVCAPEFFSSLSISPFYGEQLERAESMSDNVAILTQLFLAEINMYCVINGVSTANFGKLLEGELLSNSGQVLRGVIAVVVKACFYEDAKVEETIAKLLNEHFLAFEMTRKLLDQEVSHIIRRFHLKVKQIHDAEHLDEFMVCEVDALPFERMTEDCAYVVGNKICFDLMAIAKQIDLRDVPGYARQLDILSKKKVPMPASLTSNKVETRLDIDPSKYNADFMSNLFSKDIDFNDVSRLLLYNTNKGPLYLALDQHKYKALSELPEWRQAVMLALANSVYGEDFDAIRGSVIGQTIPSKAADFIQLFHKGGSQTDIDEALTSLSLEELIAIDSVSAKTNALWIGRINLLSKYASSREEFNERLEKRIWIYFVYAYSISKDRDITLCPRFIDKVVARDIQQSVVLLGDAIKYYKIGGLALRIKRDYPKLGEVIKGVLTKNIDWFLESGADSSIKSHLLALEAHEFKHVFSGEASSRAVNHIVARIDKELFEKIAKTHDIVKLRSLLSGVDLESVAHRLLYLSLYSDAQIMSCVVKHIRKDKIKLALSSAVYAKSNLGHCANDPVKFAQLLGVLEDIISFDEIVELINEDTQWIEPLSESFINHVFQQECVETLEQLDPGIKLIVIKKHLEYALSKYKFHDIKKLFDALSYDSDLVLWLLTSTSFDDLEGTSFRLASALMSKVKPDSIFFFLYENNTLSDYVSQKRYTALCHVLNIVKKLTRADLWTVVLRADPILEALIQGDYKALLMLLSEQSDGFYRGIGALALRDWKEAVASLLRTYPQIVGEFLKNMPNDVKKSVLEVLAREDCFLDSVAMHISYYDEMPELLNKIATNGSSLKYDFIAERKYAQLKEVVSQLNKEDKLKLYLGEPGNICLLGYAIRCGDPDAIKVLLDGLSPEELDAFLKVKPENYLRALRIRMEELEDAEYSSFLQNLSDEALIKLLDVKVDGVKFIDLIRRCDVRYSKMLVERLPDYAYKKGYSNKCFLRLLRLKNEGVCDLIDRAKVNVPLKEEFYQFIGVHVLLNIVFFGTILAEAVIIAVIRARFHPAAIVQSFMYVCSRLAHFPFAYASLFLLCMSVISWLLGDSITLAVCDMWGANKDNIFRGLLESGQITFRERCALFLCGKFSWAFKAAPKPMLKMSPEMLDQIKGSGSILGEDYYQKVMEGLINTECGRRPTPL